MLPSIARRHESSPQWMSPLLFALTWLGGFALTWSLIGCEQKEKILDIKTPAVDVEINKTEQGIEIESKRNRSTKD